MAHFFPRAREMLVVPPDHGALRAHILDEADRVPLAGRAGVDAHRIIRCVSVWPPRIRAFPSSCAYAFLLSRVEGAVLKPLRPRSTGFPALQRRRHGRPQLTVIAAVIEASRLIMADLDPGRVSAELTAEARGWAYQPRDVPIESRARSGEEGPLSIPPRAATNGSCVAGAATQGLRRIFCYYRRGRCARCCAACRALDGNGLAAAFGRPRYRRRVTIPSRRRTRAANCGGSARNTRRGRWAQAIAYSHNC